MKKLVIIISICTQVFAQWPTSPDSSLLLGFGSLKNAVSDGQGGVYVVHHEYFGRCTRINHEGEFVWQNIYLDHSNDEAHPHSVALASDSCLLISYQDVLFIESYDHGDAHIRVQKISPEGEKLWGEGVIVTPDNASGSYDNYPALVRSRVISDDTGGAIVVFTDCRNNPAGEVPEMYMQRISASGEILWDSLGVFIDDRNMDFKYMKLTGEGDVLLIYKRQNLSFVTHVLAQLIDENGSVLLLDGPYDFNQNPLGHFNLNSRDMLFYTDYREKVFQMDLNFQQIWTDQGLTISDSLDFIYDLSPDDRGGVIVQFTKDQDSNRQYCQWVTNDGTLRFTPSGVYSLSIDIMSTSATISDSNSFIVSYQARRSHLAQRVDIDGNLLWAEPTTLCTMNNISMFQTWVIYDDEGGIIYVYDDDNRTYVTQMGPNGNIGSITGIGPPRIVPFTHTLISAYPNPFNPNTTLEYEIPEMEDVSLVIYDIVGREVKTLISTSQSPGSNQASWDGINQDGHQVAGGMYFAKLQAGEYSSTVKLVFLK